MSYADWLKLNPTSGDGNASMEVGSHEPHKGRVRRETSFDVIQSNDNFARVIVDQLPKEEYVEMEQEAYVGSEGGSVTVFGNSNSSKLTFMLYPDKTNPLVLTLPEYYEVNGLLVKNGDIIPGDPGKEASYNFAIIFTNIAENTSTEGLLSVLRVRTEGGLIADTMVIQEPTDEFIHITPDTVDLTVDGDVAEVRIQSSGEWTVNEEDLVWDDESGDAIVLTPSTGSDDVVVEITSNLNEGLDREKIVRIEMGSTTANITVKQVGMREVFNASDGAFILSDGGTFNVLKS